MLFVVCVGAAQRPQHDGVQDQAPAGWSEDATKKYDDGPPWTASPCPWRLVPNREHPAVVAGLRDSIRAHSANRIGSVWKYLPHRFPPHSTMHCCCYYY